MRRLNEYLVTGKQKKPEEYKVYRYGFSIGKGIFLTSCYVMFDNLEKLCNFFKEYIKEDITNRINISLYSNIKKHLDKGKYIGLRPERTYYSYNNSANNFAWVSFDMNEVEFESILDDPDNFNIEYWEENGWDQKKLIKKQK